MKDLELLNVKLQTIVKFLFLQNKAPKEIHDCMLEALSDMCLSYSSMKKWCASFQHGDFETEDATRSGRPSTVWTQEIVDHVHDLFLADQWIFSWNNYWDSRDAQGTGWVYNSYTLGYAETVSQMGAEMFGCRSEMKFSGHLQVDLQFVVVTFWQWLITIDETCLNC